MISFWI